MRLLDWLVLGISLIGIVVYGVWRGGSARSGRDYLLAGREMRWRTVLLSMMATQASAITFLSTPGQAYSDGMRFVQFYLGLPLAMIVLAAVAVPLYHRLDVYTAYEFLERRLDGKTRLLAAALFLVQRGLAAGLTIFAPSLILSVALGWDLFVTNLLTGGLVVVYTTLGGTRAVSRTQSVQMGIIVAGLAAAFAVVVLSLPTDVGLIDALRVAGKAGKLNAIDLSFDLNNRYTLWSGLLGGFFLQLSYFGTDQSQVQRYLTARSETESRLALLANGIVKVPMQFVILLLGAVVFAFYQFHGPPLFFNPVAVEQARGSSAAGEFEALEARYVALLVQREGSARALVAATRSGDAAAVEVATEAYRSASSAAEEVRRRGIDVIRQAAPGTNPSDTNYVFLRFVIDHLPVGLVGLVLAMVFAASMSSTASELNALASTSVVDVYRRLLRKDASEPETVMVGKLATLLWGALAIGFAEYASRLGSLVEAVNILGSLFYGTILGIFLLAFFIRVSGTAAFAAAIVSEVGVIGCFVFTGISFLWYNVLGCLGVVVMAVAIDVARRRVPAVRKA
jgi:Na+/proline symporter